MDRYYVYPQDGAWVARKGEDSILGEDYPDRSSAMEAARDHRGDEREDVYVKEGDDYKRVGVFVKYRGPEALWLLREDGSVYGEVDHEVAEGGGQPIIVKLAPVSQNSKAGEVG